MVSTLSRKLLRDVWRLKSQLLAIMAVMAIGITVFVMFLGMIRSLDATRSVYYERTRFADIFANATRAPKILAARLREIPGVAAVETRIAGAAVLSLNGFAEPVTATVHSVPNHGRPALNDLVLRAGRWVDPRRAQEVMINEAFAEAHDLKPGDRFEATLHGVRQELTVTAIVLSPEYVYAIAPGRIIADNLRYGILWMAERQLEAAYDLNGAFNSVLLGLRRDAIKGDVIDHVDRLLDRYGGTGAFARRDHISDRILRSELDELRTQVRILPPVFLAVAAFLLNIVVGRMIATEREIIGLMKAFGYSRWQVAGHYAKLVGVVVIGAFIVGGVLGTWLGRLLAELYITYFRFPLLYFDAGWGPYLAAGMVAVVAGGLGALSATRAALKLAPAEAMRPPAPTDYSKSVGASLLSLRFIDEATRMVLRHLLRHPRRSGLTIIGIALASGLLTGARGNIDGVNKMIFMTFERAEIQDVTVTFIEPRALGTVYELDKLPGVHQVQPFRAVAAILTSGVEEKRQGLMAVMPGGKINRLINVDGEPVAPPEEGLVLSKPLSDTLRVGLGDSVFVEVIEGRRPTLRLPIVGIVETYVGSPAFVDLHWLNRLLDEPPSISGAHMTIDPAHADALFQDLKAMPAVAGVELTQAAYAGFRNQLDETVGVSIAINTAFSALIIFGVVYNAARISLSERGRELASMRVLGFTRAEVSFLLLGEMACITLLALPLGAAFGALLSYGISRSFSDDLFVLPFALQIDTIASAAVITIIAAILSGLIVRRRIDRLDMIAVLKTRE